MEVQHCWPSFHVTGMHERRSESKRSLPPLCTCISILFYCLRVSLTVCDWNLQHIGAKCVWEIERERDCVITVLPVVGKLLVANAHSSSLTFALYGVVLKGTSCLIIQSKQSCCSGQILRIGGFVNSWKIHMQRTAEKRKMPKYSKVSD